MEATDTPAGEARPQVPVLVYHKIEPRFEYSITRVTPRRFARHLDWLLEHGYRTIRLSDVVRASREGTSLPARSVVIAFDDGFESVHRYAYPLLKARGCTATVFPVIGYAGREDDWDVQIGGRRFRHLTWDQMRELRDAGMEIGSHTLHHPDLTRLPDAQARYELEASRALIRRRLGVPGDTLSCPFGGYTPRIARHAADAGYSGMVIVRRRLPHTVHGVLALPGVCVYLTTNLRDLRYRVERRPPSRFSKAVERGIGWCAGRTPLVKGPPAYPGPPLTL